MSDKPQRDQIECNNCWEWMPVAEVENLTECPNCGAPLSEAVREQLKREAKRSAKTVFYID